MAVKLIKAGRAHQTGGPIRLPNGDAAFEMHGGTFKLDAPEFYGGSGKSTAVRAFRGDLRWIGGGASDSLGAYLLYAGDVTRGDDWICSLDIKDVVSLYGNRHEATMRLMGAQGTLRNLKLAVMASGWEKITKRPQVGQFRHARCIVSDSTLIGMLANGQLAPREANPKEAAIYTSFAERFPTHLVFERCVLTGGACDAGRMFALYRGCVIVARDPRGHESDTAFTQKGYKTDYGFHAPTTLLIGVKITAKGYRKIAADGVIIGPDCFLNGSRITPETKPGQAKLLADKIEKGAQGY